MGQPRHFDAFGASMDDQIGNTMEITTSAEDLAIQTTSTGNNCLFKHLLKLEKILLRSDIDNNCCGFEKHCIRIPKSQCRYESNHTSNSIGDWDFFDWCFNLLENSQLLPLSI